MRFDSANNGGQGDFLTICLAQAVFDKAVVVGFQGDLFVPLIPFSMDNFLTILCSISLEIRVGVLRS